MDEDALVFVIDLRAETMREVADEVARAAEGAFVPRVIEPAEEPVKAVALWLDSGPVVLPIEATCDARWLDALARLVRFAVLRGETVAEVGRRYGGEYERGLVEAGRLPEWALGGAEGLPEEVRRALGGRAEERE